MSFLNTRTKDEEYSNDPEIYLNNFADDITNNVAGIKEFTDEKKDRMPDLLSYHRHTREEI